ncbi:ribosome assembly RNA-binding protein YhbY [Chitinimonas arctica]|uniref:Ribosome assembly RNA-binding protein YhbY n=1 Tax=Chitinimonas arctica TaxID=2594795 RepID=A0A516SHK6_9NEIS|nr:ribosome assembly RNA-binding protein YhbY [Chitinimonas arctica]QDQ27637.1 ribosome assembly RNA-binding protein YhbY [Chitinimonas arctica]
MELTRDERLYLRTQAHQLSPVVMIGNNGLTDAVMREIALNLDAHELIKVRVLGDDREQRSGWLADICTALNCSPVQQIGKLLVLYRPTQDGKPKIQLPRPGQKKPTPKALEATARKAAAKPTVATGRAGKPANSKGKPASKYKSGK